MSAYRSTAAVDPDEAEQPRYTSCSAASEPPLQANATTDATTTLIARAASNIERAIKQHALPVAPCAGVAELQPGVDRHVVQHEAIVAHARALGLLSPDFTVVDFGAGSGGLSRAVHAAAGGGACVLIDRKERSGAGGEGFERLCVDVASLTADDIVRATRGGTLTAGGCVVVSNHLCGAALDVALRRAVEAWHLPDPAARRLVGVLAATCCHDQCTWETYAGRDVFGAWGLGELEFGLACRWSRLAPRRGKDDATRERVVQEAARLGVSPADAARFGLRCRQLLDTGRALYLERHGFDVSLANHVPFSVTADNVVIRCAASAVLDGTTL